MTFFLAAFLAFQDEKATAKIAEIESYAGTVELVDAKKTSRAVTKFGRRLKNSDVRDEDTVKTSAGSQAVIVFPDRSRYTLKEKSEVQILQKTLPKPTAEGNTIGRRLRLLVGNLTSEVMPNTEIRTDFETPAGSAAVRGTMLRMAVEGASLRLETLAGTVRFYNVEFATRLDVGRGQCVRLRKGSLTIEVVEDGGNPLPGDFGARHCMLTKGDHVTLNDAGPNLNCDITQGTLNVDGSDTDKPFVAPKGAGVAGEDCGLDPNLPTGAPIPEGGAPDSGLIGMDQPIGENPVGDATTTVATCETNFSTSSSSSSTPPPPPPPPPPLFPMTLDNFNRAAGTLIGDNGDGIPWAEEVQNWIINAAGEAQVTIPFSNSAQLAKAIGFLPTWDIQAQFKTDDFVNVREQLEVNAISVVSTGCRITANLGPPSPFFQIFDGATFKTSGSLTGTAVNNSFYTVDLSFNGSQLCGSVTGAGLTGSPACIGTSVTWAGTLLRAVGTNVDTGLSHFLHLDNVIRNQ